MSPQLYLDSLAVPLEQISLNVNEMRPMIVFGQKIIGSDGPPKVIPNFEFYLPKNSIIRAPTSGKVLSVEQRESTGDFSIRILPKSDKRYTIEIDHLNNPKVRTGDILFSGQELGLPGNWDNNMGRVEIQVNDDRYYICPSLFLSRELKDELNNLMELFEHRYANPNLYQQELMVDTSCYLLKYKD